MKRWHQYNRYRLSGLWHVHTAVTDGNQSAEEIVDFAQRNEFPLVGFTEHIRQNPTYDFDRFYDTAKSAAASTDLICVVGCEAKVLDTAGSIDVSTAVTDTADIVFASFHGGTFSAEEYVTAVIEMLSNPEVDVWAHPFTYPNRHSLTLTDEDIAAIVKALDTHDVLFERNVSRPIPPQYLTEQLDNTTPIIGYDMHDIHNWDSAGPQELEH